MVFCFLLIRRQPRFTLTDPLFPYPTRVRSPSRPRGACRGGASASRPRRRPSPPHRPTHRRGGAGRRRSAAAGWRFQSRSRGRRFSSSSAIFSINLRATEIGRAHVCTPGTNAQLVCSLLLEKKKKNKK